MNLQREATIARRILREQRITEVKRFFEKAYQDETEGMFTDESSIRLRQSGEAYLGEAKTLGFSVRADEVGHVHLRHARLPRQRIEVHPTSRTFSHIDQDEGRYIKRGELSELGAHMRHLVGGTSKATEAFRRAYEHD